MSNIKRYYIPDSIVFVTTVTKNRNQIFMEERNHHLLFQTIESIKLEIPFDLIAYVILPDHFHLLIRLKNKDNNFSKVLQLIKGRFTHAYKINCGITSSVSLWQRRFWDHIIRDEHDLQNHFDYIHWNPVKHGFVDAPNKWKLSSFIQWTNNGLYDLGWGYSREPENIRKMNFE